MKKMVQNKVFGWALGIALMVVFSVQGQAWVKFNGGEYGFDVNGQKEIEDLIITGASNFLQSYSRLLVVFRELEQQRLQPANMPALLKQTDLALQDMEKTRATYVRLYQKALDTPYNPAVIGRLKAFDYTGFRAERSLGNKSEAAVISALKQGNIREVFRSAWMESEQILDSLMFLRHSLQNGSVPGVEFLWALNRAYSDSLLSGQAAARIFYEIAGN
jgi:hypothetical protein